MIVQRGPQDVAVLQAASTNKIRKLNIDGRKQDEYVVFYDGNGFRQQSQADNDNKVNISIRNNQNVRREEEDMVIDREPSEYNRHEEEVNKSIGEIDVAVKGNNLMESQNEIEQESVMLQGRSIIGPEILMQRSSKNLLSRQSPSNSLQAEEMQHISPSRSLRKSINQQSFIAPGLNESIASRKSTHVTLVNQQPIMQSHQSVNFMEKLTESKDMVTISNNMARMSSSLSQKDMSHRTYDNKFGGKVESYDDKIIGKMYKVPSNENRYMEQKQSAISVKDNLFSYLMPNGLQPFSGQFISVKNISEPNYCPPPPPSDKELALEDKKRVEEEDLLAIKIEKEREKTNKIMLNIIDRQLKITEEKANEINEYFAKTNDQMEEYEKFIKEEHAKKILNNIVSRVDNLQKRLEKDNLIDEADKIKDVRIEEMIIENRVLIDEVELRLKYDDHIEDDSEEFNKTISELSESIVNKLYQQVKGTNVGNKSVKKKGSMVETVKRKTTPKTEVKKTVQKKNTTVKKNNTPPKKLVRPQKKLVEHAVKKKAPAEIKKDKMMNTEISHAFESMAYILKKNLDFKTETNV